MLTPREQEVLSLIREGLTNGQIAERLGISESGARYHVSEIIGKLGATSRFDAVARWEEQAAFARPSPFAVIPYWLRGFRLAQVAVIGTVLGGLLLLAIGVALQPDRASPQQPVGEPSPTASPEIGDLAQLLDPDDQIALAREDGSVALLALQSMRQTDIVAPGACGAQVLSLQWSPSGDLLLCTGHIVGNDVYILAVFDVNGHQIYRTEDFYGDYRWSPTGDLLALVTGSVDDVAGRGVSGQHGTLRIIDASGATLLEDHGVFWRVAWSSDGSRLAAARTDGTIGFYDPKAGMVDSIEVATQGVADWALDDRRLLTVAPFATDSQYSVVKLLSLEDRQFLSIGTGRVNDPTQFWLSPDRKFAVIWGEEYHTAQPQGFELQLLNLENGNVTSIPQSRISFGSDHMPEGFVQFDRTGSWLLWVDVERGVWEADLSSLQITQVNSIAGNTFSPDLAMMLAHDGTAASTTSVHAVQGSGSIALGRVTGAAWRP